MITILFANFKVPEVSIEKSGGVYVLKRACASSCCSSRHSLSRCTHPPKACTANSLSSAGVKPKLSPLKKKEKDINANKFQVQLLLRKRIKEIYTYFD